ncbi:MAG: hypothetical protein J0M34_09490 [Alphaproteobacteria bacterium]|nr:hypothetical protein [Alphaproteobacteria bacterium]
MGDKREEPIVPYNHSTVGAVFTRAGGTAGGAAEKGISTVAWTIGGLALFGAVVGLVGATIGWAAVGTALSSLLGGAEVSANIANVFWAVVGTGALGAVVGALISPITGFFGAVKGGFDGYDRADTRISQERGAAQMMNAEIQALQSQAMIMQASQPQARAGDRYAGASTMLQADHSALQAAQYDGRMNGLQLEAAR